MEKRENKILKYILIAISTIFLGVMLILPLVYVISIALSQGINEFIKTVSNKYATKAVGLTIEVTLITVIINTIFGVISAWLISMYQFKGRKFISTIMDLPLAVSPIIAGLIYVLTFGRQSALYSILKIFDLKIIFAVPGILLATIFVTFPFVSREIVPVLNAKGTQEEEAAALMGAGGFEIFRKITFPHIKWSILYGVVLCSARAMGEFGAVSVLSGHLKGKTNTMPLYIELLYQGYDFTGAFAMSAILVIMAIIILVIKSILENRKVNL